MLQPGREVAYAGRMHRGVTQLAALVAVVVLGSACGGGNAPAGSTRSAGGRQWNITNAPSASSAPAATGIVRRALLIGNGKYQNEKAALKNPPSDVAALQQELAKVGFVSVVSKSDLTLRQLQDAVTEFGAALGDKEMGVVFYAGHGIELGGRNYLVPVDFPSETTEAQAPDRAYPLDRLLESVRRGGRPGPSIVILDACRSNPFLAKRGSGRGLADIEDLPTQTAVWFATSAKTAASDGDGRNSPFTSALVGSLSRLPSRPVQLLEVDVKSEVLNSTGGAQRPMFKSNLDVAYAFNGGLDSPSAAAASVAGAPVSRALVVGVGDYKDARLAHFAVKTQRDVSAIKRALGRAGYGEIATLEGERATAHAIREALTSLRRSAKAGDRVAFYFAGLGLAMGGASPEGDGRDEALLPSDASPNERSTVILDDDLGGALHDLRRTVGATGHVLVALDAYRLFDDGVREISPTEEQGLGPITLLQPSAGAASEGWKLFPKERDASRKDVGGDAVGALTRGIATALDEALPNEPYRALVGAMRAASGRPDAFALEGDIDVAVRTGEPAIRGSFLPVNRAVTYGPNSLYLEAGRIDGVFPGTEVDVHAPRTRTTPSRAIGHGVVMQAGKRWARVELDRPVAEPGTLWALPVTRAMPQIPVRVALDSSVVTERAALEAELSAITPQGATAGAPVDLRVVEQGAYFYVQTPAKKTVAGPLPKGDAKLAVAHHVWRQAYLEFLRGGERGWSPSAAPPGWRSSVVVAERDTGQPNEVPLGTVPDATVRWAGRAENVSVVVKAAPVPSKPESKPEGKLR